MCACHFPCESIHATKQIRLSDFLRVVAKTVLTGGCTLDYDRESFLTFDCCGIRRTIFAFRSLTV